MSRGAIGFGLLAIVVPGGAVGAPLIVTKTATVISDPLGNLAPKSLPGAIVDYKVLFTNPVANVTKPVAAVVIDDVLPTTVILRVSDLIAGQGPVEFLDGGSVQLLTYASSGLTCPFVSLSSTTDCIYFSDGTSWSYVPTPDANGYDANIRAIRIKPTTTFSTGGSFQIRYRVMIR